MPDNSAKWLANAQPAVPPLMITARPGTSVRHAGLDRFLDRDGHAYSAMVDFCQVTGQDSYAGFVGMIPMKAVNHPWIPGDIVGGSPALDLVNTISGWNRDPEDWVPDIASFLVWARMCGVLDEREQNAAARNARNSPPAAERVLASVKELRFALRDLIDALEHRRPPKPTDLSVIDAWRSRLAVSEHVVVVCNKIDFTINSDISALELPGLRLTGAALSLLKEFPATRIKTCAALDCGWKFVDESKNRSRRWCDMAVCGNLAKARHYRARKSQTS